MMRVLLAALLVACGARTENTDSPVADASPQIDAVALDVVTDSGITAWPRVWDGVTVLESTHYGWFTP